jgi:ankyrin repeat protein
MKNKENNTALHEAVWTVPDLTNLEAKDICCRLLLEHGADVNVKNKLGKSPADFELLKHFRFSESDSIKG